MMASIKSTIIFSILGSYIGAQIFVGPNFGLGILLFMAFGLHIGAITGIIYSILVWLSGSHLLIFKRSNSLLIMASRGALLGALASTWAWTPSLIKHSIFRYNCDLCKNSDLLQLISSSEVTVNLIFIIPAVICGIVCYKATSEAITPIQPN